MESHRLVLDTPAKRTLDAVAEAAEHWGAGWQPHGRGGRLILPVIAGLRRGWQAGRVRAQDRAGGCELTFEVDETNLKVNGPAAAVLATGGVGGLAVALWPFWEPLLALAPVGAALALVAWFLVTSRLRHAGAREFFELVEVVAGGPPAGSDERRAASGE